MQDFFGTVPEAFAALWEFIEGFYGVAIFAVSLVLIALLLWLAKVIRPEHGWLSAVFGMMGVGIAFWWAFGIGPSAFTFFMDAERDLLEGTMVPAALPGMDNFYEVFRDTMVVGWHVVVIAAFGVAMLWVQRRYPRTLAEGEEKQPATGGYR